MKDILQLSGPVLYPLSQRCRFVLEAGNVHYEYLPTSDKEVLLHTGTGQTISDAPAITEYLADVYPDTPKHPQDPELKEQHRGWISLIDTIHTQLDWTLQQPTLRPNLTTKVNLSKISSLCEKLASEKTGPYFSGKELTLVDAAAAPLFIQLNWLRQKNPALNLLAGLTPLKEWIHAMMNTIPVMKIYDGDLKEKFMAALPLSVDTLRAD